MSTSNRFKHRSYQQTLKDVHLPAPYTAKPLDSGEENEFNAQLETQRQLCITSTFVYFADRAQPLSGSLPLLVFNAEKVAELWIESVQRATSKEDESLKALFHIFPALLSDLRTTLQTFYDRLLTTTLDALQPKTSPDTIIALLTALSVLFKHLLIPQHDIQVTSRTWDKICGVLPKLHLEVRRAIAEVWAAVLRRIKPTSRSEAVIDVVRKCRDGLGDVSAWTLVFCCKSVAQSLHSSTLTFLQPFLLYHLSEGDQDSAVLVRRVLTALAHHTKGADGYEIIAIHIVELFEKHSTEEGWDRLLEVVHVPLAVRGGSRMNPTQLSSLLSTTIQRLPPQGTDATLLVQYFCALLLSPLPASSTTTSIKLLEILFQSGHGLAITETLAQLNYSHFKTLLLPLLKRYAAKRSDDPNTIAVLAALVRSGKLDVSEDEGWAARLQESLLILLNSESRDVPLDDILVLLPLVLVSSPEKRADVLSLLSRRVDTILAQDGDAKELGQCLCALPRFQSSSAPIVKPKPVAFQVPELPPKARPRHSRTGSSLESLLKEKEKEEAAHQTLPELTDWTRTILSHERWASDSDTMNSLVALCQTVDRSTIAISFHELYTLPLQANLLSHSRSLRLSALRLVHLLAPSGIKDMAKKCLTAEEVSLDVAGARERVLRIGRVVAALLGPGPGDDEIDLCTRWLTSQLKIPLRPLWSPASGALASLASSSAKNGDTVWQILWVELSGLAPKIPNDDEDEKEEEEPTIPSTIQDDETVDAGDYESEKTWRDPVAHRLRVAARTKLASTLGITTTDDRFDPRSYETQLLSSLADSRSIVEKHNRDLITFFFSLFPTHNRNEGRLPFRRSLLISYLKLFSKLSNPKALYLTDRLKELYTSLLSHSDRTVQITALSCFMTYWPPSSEVRAKEEDILKPLLDDVRFRETLASLSVTFGMEDEHSSDELVDVILRLCYGVMLRDASRKASVLALFTGIPQAEKRLGTMVHLMLRPILSTSSPVTDWTGIDTARLDGSSEKQQVGYLNLLGDALHHLGFLLLPWWPILLGTTVDIVARANSGIDSAVGCHAPHEVDDIEDKDRTVASTGNIKALRSIRQLGLKRIAQFLLTSLPDSTSFEFRPFLQVAFPSFIVPRLPLLAKENTQSPSALLDLFFAFTQERDYLFFLVEFDPTVLDEVYKCLTAKSVKPSVVSRIWDIVDSILQHAENDVDVQERILKPYTTTLLSSFSHTLPISSKQDVDHRQISLLSRLAPYAQDSAQAQTLLSLVQPLLLRSHTEVHEKIKVDLLHTMSSLLPLSGDLSSDDTEKLNNCLARLFQTLRSRPARLSLVATFSTFSKDDHLVALVTDLNAYSTRRMDEPDFEKRLTAFAQVLKSPSSMDLMAWRVILHNAFHFIQDPLELAIRSNSAHVLKAFVDVVASDVENAALVNLFTKMFYPALKNSLRTKSDIVRGELVVVLGYAVEKCSHILDALKEVQPLLAAGDEEASFFNNIVHLQIHRRSRALRRLGDFVENNEHGIRSSSVSEIFVPLIANYISPTPTTGDHHLVNDAIICLGRLSKRLGWGAWNGLVRDYLKLATKKDEGERVYVRALVSILEGFSFAMQSSSDSMDVDEASSQPSTIITAVNTSLLPTLLGHLEKHDEKTDDTARIPLSIGIVHIAKALPASLGELQVTRLLTILSQILRSHSQETRDLVRDALTRIVGTSLGPSYLPLVLGELRRALTRGPQLHVLAYTAHHLLAHLTLPPAVTESGSPPLPVNFDAAVVDVAHISSEVIFGNPAKDVQSEGFKTKLREVKGSHSLALHSFEILASHVSSRSLSSLLVPVKAIMTETESVKVMSDVEELLKRIAVGIEKNSIWSTEEILGACHALIEGKSEFLKPSNETRVEDHSAEIIETSRLKTPVATHYENNSFRFVLLGLDILGTGLRRNRFDTSDHSIISRLQTLVVDVGNALYSTSSAVILSALKCAGALCRCPLPSLERHLPVFLSQTLDIVRRTGNTESDVVQGALKALSIMLRDGPPVDMKEKDVIFLLKLVAPDLEEPSRQAAVFSLLRAVISRKFVVPEIYDLMHTVSSVMVTSQSPSVQELCRGILLQFLLDYPQGKGRLENQITFLVKNLEYKYESGRKSVLEILGALVAKLQSALVKEHQDKVFVGLVMVLSNDDSSKCREMAGTLVKTLFGRLDDGGKTIILQHCHAWVEQQQQPQLKRVALQIYSMVMEDEALDRSVAIADITLVLEQSSQQLAALEQGEDESDDTMDVDLPWENAYHSFTLLFKLLSNSSTLTPSLLRSTRSHLLYPHAWVRLASSRLLGLWFSLVGLDAPMEQTEVKEIANKLCVQLKSEHLDDVMGLQVVKNLFWIGKWFSSRDSDKEDDKSEDDDPLPWLFSKLSYQLKSAHIMRTNKAAFSRTWHLQPLYILRFFAAMTQQLSSSRLEHFLVHILTPVTRIAEDEVTKDEGMDTLKSTALELQALLQEKVEITAFSGVYNRLRRGVVETQQNRKTKKALQVTKNPELAAQRKMKRNEGKKESRKRKNTLFAESNGRTKRGRFE
ncbi:armadillo-type protein [Flagelloscypha sp. PMI_526]|nr:armadillo-type protein [Flagelloscypha sp. PMI_526]